MITSCLLPARELLEPEYEVGGTFSDGRELLNAAISLHPDVALVDFGMPLLNGLEAGRRLKQANPKLKVTYFTMLTDRQREVLQMLAEGRSLREIASVLQISYRPRGFTRAGS